MKSFASDNYAGVLPEVMDAILAANKEHASSYGNDPVTASCNQLFADIFGNDPMVRYVFNGTGANVLSVSACTQSFNAVLCADISHICNDESSAPETFTGCRFFALPTNAQGKLEPQTIAARLIRKGDMHFPQIAMVSLTQSTEYGTVYTLEELKAISAVCRQHNVYLHIDGSRLFNALASLQCSPEEFVRESGVDILSLGGTKSGMMYGEAVLAFHPDLKPLLHYKHKQSMQLASKTRFIAAQFIAMLQHQLWLRGAGHANQMAQYLQQALQTAGQVKITRPVQANVVFACIPESWNEVLMQHTPFYVWREDINEVRLMCAWDTQKEEVDAFVALVAQIAG
ncbi:MAG: low specificity L-threonine aldolase [Chitinophagaceae bacterium]